MIKAIRFAGLHLIAGILAVGLGLATASSASAAVNSNNGNNNAGSADRGEARLQEQVRHQLAMLPYLSVFDNLQYSVDGSTVILQGQVRNSVLKPDVEGAVKHIEGVTKVVNNIEVLPPSPMDEQIRRHEYRAIFGFASLGRYSIEPVPSIHIIVKNGNVTLEGTVANQSDKNAAYLRANGVPNVFSVTNNLQVVAGS